jgi:predicted PurR-regulated permease PerM
MRRSSPISEQWFWITLISICVLFLYVFRAILLPFALSFMLAYGLSPVVEKYLRYIPSRTIVALSLIACLVFFLSIGFALILPGLEDEFSKLATRIPSYISYLWSLCNPMLEKLLALFPEDQSWQMRKEWMLSAGQSVGPLAAMLQPLMSGSIALAGTVSTSCLIPIVLFYFLRDWQSVVRCIENCLPLPALPVFIEIRGRIRRSLNRYLRGQFLIAVILSGYYSVGLFTIGIESAGVLGVITGFLSFIPFVGAMILCCVTLIICAVHYASVGKAVALIAMFLFAQFLEAHVLYPRFVGKEARLHPVWVLFALLAGSQLGGVVGLVIAIPFASILNATARFTSERFRDSSLRLGVSSETA